MWKFHDRLESLRKGLNHNDYKHVVSIIKHYANGDKSAFTRHCHRALVEEINKSQIHIDNIVKIAGNDSILDYNYDIQYPTIAFPSLPTREDWTYCTLQVRSLPPSNQ